MNWGQEYRHFKAKAATKQIMAKYRVRRWWA